MTAGQGSSARPIAVLAFTQMMTWGILIYPPVLTMPHIAAAHGWSLAQGMAGFSFGLIVSGLLSPTACGLIDSQGGRRVMAVGALAGACGLAGMTLAEHPAAYAVCWLLLGIAMSSCLYDAAFATLTTIFGAAARRPITLVTFAGGLASTVGWPATLFLIGEVGWRGTYLIFAAIFACVIAPLHAFALPRATHHLPLGLSSSEDPSPPAASGRVFLLLASGFAVYAFVLSGMTSNLLALLQRGGLSATTAVSVGALFGPAQVVSRAADLVFGSRVHPLWIARGAMTTMMISLAALAVTPMTESGAALFAVAFGASNGVMTIARGALPLAIFGPQGYGRLIGRIARPGLIVQALAPFVVAFTLERFSNQAVLESGAIACVVVLGCFLALGRPPLHRK